MLDIDGDFHVGIGEFLAVLGEWGAPGGPADFDGSGLVGMMDLLFVLGFWGPCYVE